eukprot:scaffold46767_cov175-Skeletonema_marinoi.AAC.2
MASAAVGSCCGGGGRSLDGFHRFCHPQPSPCPCRNYNYFRQRLVFITITVAICCRYPLSPPTS